MRKIKVLTAATRLSVFDADSPYERLRSRLPNKLFCDISNVLLNVDELTWRSQMREVAVRLSIRERVNLR